MLFSRSAFSSWTLAVLGGSAAALHEHPVPTATKEQTSSSSVGRCNEVIKALSIDPTRDAAIRRQIDALPPERPAHVADRDEERRGHAVEFADLAAEQRGLAAESHRADAGLVGFRDDGFLQFGEHRIGIGVVDRAQELRLAARHAADAV